MTQKMPFPHGVSGVGNVCDMGDQTPEVRCSCESFGSDGVICMLPVGWLQLSDSLDLLHQLVSAKELNELRNTAGW